MNGLSNAGIQIPKFNALFEHMKRYRYYFIIPPCCDAMVYCRILMKREPQY